MKIKVCDAPIEVLNYLVAKIECLPKDRLYLFNGKPFVDRECLGHIDTLRCEFSTNWTQGGPIIERVGINVTLRYGSLPPNHVHDVWDAVIKPEFYTSGRPESGVQKETLSSGPTPLIAAMRCYCCAKLGNEVEVPDELMRKD